MQSPGERIENSQLFKLKRVYLHADIWEICFKMKAVKLNIDTDITCISKAQNSNEWNLIFGPKKRNGYMARRIELKLIDVFC